MSDPLAGLGRARVALGVVFLLRTTPVLAAFHVPFLSDAAPLLAWPDGHVRFAPTIPVVPAALIGALCILRTLAAFAFTIGWRARLAGWLAGGLGYVTVLQDPARFTTTDHVLFLGTLLLASTDAVASCAVTRAAPRSPSSSLWLVRAWVASIYFWSALSKMRADWFDGRTFLLLAREGRLRPFVAAALTSTEALRTAMAYGTVAMELGLAVLLLAPRSRRIALALAVTFHLGLEWAASPDLLGWAMIALLLVFLDPQEVSQSSRVELA